MSSLLPAKHWEQFGSWLRQMRRAADLTQAQVAKKAELSENQVIRIEKGDSGTKRDTVIALAQAIGIDVGEALNKAGFALVDPEGLSYQKGVLVPPVPKKPKNYMELLGALEKLGIEIDWATINKNLENYTRDDFAELIERIKFDTDFSVRRKAK